MKALLRHSDTPKDFSLGEAPNPAIQPGFVKLKVAYAGICGSDLHIYLGQDPGLPQPVHGHEFSATIAEIGEGVEGFTVGQKVTTEHTFSVCGLCENCRAGRYQLCTQRHSIGFDIPGAFAEYLLVDPRYIHPLPSGVGLQQGALTEPLACIVHGVELVDTKPAMPVLVVGPGPMGLLAGLVLKAYGCQVDICGAPADAQRLDIAQKAGLRVVEAPQSSSYPLVAECSGSAGGISVAIGALQKGGTLLQVGITAGAASLPYDQVVYKELRIQGTFCHVWKDWRQALRLQEAGLLDLSPVITSVVPLEGWKDAFEALVNKEGMKTLLAVAGEE